MSARQDYENRMSSFRETLERYIDPEAGYRAIANKIRSIDEIVSPVTEAKRVKDFWDLEFLGGTSFEKASLSAYYLSTLSNRSVCFKFNGMKVQIVPPAPAQKDDE